MFPTFNGNLGKNIFTGFKNESLFHFYGQVDKNIAGFSSFPSVSSFGITPFPQVEKKFENPSFGNVPFSDNPTFGNVSSNPFASKEEPKFFFGNPPSSSNPTFGNHINPPSLSTIPFVPSTPSFTIGRVANKVSYEYSKVGNKDCDGFIYCTKTKSEPNCFKIGRTKHLYNRLSSLNTSLTEENAHKFIFAIEVNNYINIENRIKNKLSSFRQGNREFYKTNKQHIYEIFKSFSSKVYNDFPQRKKTQTRDMRNALNDKQEVIFKEYCRKDLRGVYNYNENCIIFRNMAFSSPTEFANYIIHILKLTTKNGTTPRVNGWEECYAVFDRYNRKLKNIYKEYL